MLSAEAYSFRLKSRLAISLSWVAGYTNVIMLIACDEVVSHQTGNSTHVGRAIGQLALRQPGAVGHLFYFGFLLVMFLLGAVTSAFMTEGARRAGRVSKYILPMSLEAILLSALVMGLLLHPRPLEDGPQVVVTLSAIAALAMGLQNATITKISGAVVRTTHLTGVITDLGLEGTQLFLWWCDMMSSRRAGRYGRILKVSRRHPTVLRVLLLASIFGSFMFGAMAGTVFFELLGGPALLAPVLFLGWIVVTDYLTPIADVREIDPTADKELTALFGNIQSLLPEHVGIFRLAHHKAGRLHHAPDFGAWVDRVPKHWRVVILVISPLTQFDQDTAASLLKAAGKLKSHDRTLVVSGMNRVQFKTLMDCGITKMIDLENFVPDLEFAIARGINLASGGGE